MLVTLIGEQKIFSVRLPEKIAGKYWILDDEKPVNSNRILAVEADDKEERWIIKAAGQLRLYDLNQKETKRLELEEGKLYQLSFGRGQQSACLLAEAFTEERGIYKRYVAIRNVTMSLGRNDDNSIVISNDYVSAHHATLSYADGTWILCDNCSTNGTYVNRHRITGQVKLFPGDAVFILGVQFVVGSNFISMNNPDKSVRIHTDFLSECCCAEVVNDGIKIVDPEATSYYYLSPRFLREISPLELQVDSPTRREDRENTPLFLALGPSLLMGVASFSVGIFSAVNAARSGGGAMNTLPTMITSISMLLGMILFPIIIRRREKKLSLERETERREKYLRYLDNLRQEIQKNITIQEEVLNENNPPVTELSIQSDFWERRLWGRTPGRKDFLYLRLGAGNMPMYADIRFPEDRFSIEDDTLRDSLFAFQREERLLINVPVGISLPESRVLGIVGDKKGVFNLLNNILMQILLLHSYDEVKVICMYEKSDEKFLSFVRYAQHIWDNEEKRRFLAMTEDDLRELSVGMNKIIAHRREMDAAGNWEEVIPHYVILTTSKTLSTRCVFLTEVLQEEKLRGISVICAYDDVKSLPKECVAVVRVNESQGLLCDIVSDRNANVSFAQDTVSVSYAQQAVQMMTDRQLDLNQGRYALPEMLSFLDMYGVGKCEHLNISQRWKNNNPVKTLQTPVGVDTNGEIFCLDLHEKFHGPHGLVAGMTGSGKSEFIITYILSMAVNYHPDEVAFVLIDYKGGGLAGAFENERYRLPHLVGTITNLDGGVIMRSILSIKSELRRRQTIFNHARDAANEGTMDIYKYQKMYRSGRVEEPIPHLFIISDEFAELKSQQPEFMEQLISTARIGRSLGVHLILATQKPGGVVNEQIWANSRFKVCLKVQDRTDSNDMLKRPDAAEITETGRFYLQVGYNELFEMGQSAWAGALYLNADKTGRSIDSCIEVLDEPGNVVDRLSVPNSLPSGDNSRQIVRIMEYLDKFAREEGIKKRQLWMPEIPEDIRVDELADKYSFEPGAADGLIALVGELDDPYMQRQKLLDINFAETGNVLIYGATGSGKEMMLGAILYSLYKNYTPSELNAYILDFGAETMKMFEKAPHTGGVMTDGESEKIDNFIVMLGKEVKHRKKLFAEFGGDVGKYNESGNEKAPYILVIVNNYSHFYESYDKYEDVMITFTRECPRYGIYFVFTATNTMAVRYRMLQNFSRMFVMQMNDKSDYASILGNTGGVIPPAIKGRGILKTEETYVFQTAHIVGKEGDLSSFIRRFSTNLTLSAEGAQAKQVPVVPEFISGRAAADDMSSFEQLPLGVSYYSCSYLKLNAVEKNVLLVISQDGRDALRYAGGIIEMVSAVKDIQIIVFNGDREFNDMLDVEYEKVNKDYEDRIIKLFNTALHRNNNFKETDGRPVVDMTPMLVVFHDYEKIMEGLSRDGRDKLITILDKVEGFCNMFFVVCDSCRAVNQYYLDEWMEHRCAGEGVWVGKGIEDQKRLTITGRINELKRETDTTTGFYVSDGYASLIRLVMPSALERVNGDEG